MAAMIKAVGNMMDFICAYELNKCVKTMLFGSILMAVFLLFTRLKRMSVFCRCYLLLFVFTALLVGQSKLYYTGRLFILSNRLNDVLTPFLGGCYFAVMWVLVLIILMKQLFFRLYIRRNWKSVLLKEFMELSDDLRLQEAQESYFWSRYQKRIRIYQQSEVTIAFSGGMLHPYIVLPAPEKGREQEQAVMLRHELTHIRHGHIIWLNLVMLLRCYWWGNPLVYVWEACFRRELECVCDELCLADYNIKQAAYAEAMLYAASKCVVKSRHDYFMTGTCFLKKTRPFYEMRYRIVSMIRQLSCHAKGGKLNRRTKYILMAGAGIVICVLLLCSYPRYTNMKEIALFDSQLKPVFYDDAAVHEAVEISGRTIKIEPEAFRKLLNSYKVTDEYVYLSYNQILKVPGAGGAGEVVMVDTKDITDICYLADDGFTAKLERFILKWI